MNVFELCNSKIKRIFIRTVNYKINGNKHYQQIMIFFKFTFFLYNKWMNEQYIFFYKIMIVNNNNK